MKPTTVPRAVLFGAPIVVGLLLIAAAGLGLRYYIVNKRGIHCENNLKQLGIAMHIYHDTMKSFPSAYIPNTEGKPTHSWRVLILPYLEEQPLYDKYIFSEPWNGTHNSQLARGRFGHTYACPHVGSESLLTSYVAIVGKGCLFDGPRAPRMEDVRDTRETILLVEWQIGTSWMAPEDLAYETLLQHIKAHELPAAAKTHGNGLHALMVDGTTRFFPLRELTEERLRALCVIGEAQK